jgi:hypothetical protein
MRVLLRAILVVALALLGFSAGPAACGTSSPGNGGPGDGGGGEDSATNCYSCAPGDGNTPPPVFGGDGGSSGSGMIPFVDSPCSGTQTTISGKVYDPAGANPIYNVTVYVPGVKPLPALPEGVMCNSCANLYATPKASAVTDPDGNFKISPVMTSTLTALVPDGDNIPLVVQVGKWRKQYTIPKITACQDNPQPDKSLLLPKNHNEGSLPNIAVSTGAADSLECLLRRMGVDASEFTGGAGGPGRIHIFTGTGGATTNGGMSPDPGTTLWDKDTDINPFDVVLLSCEGAETMHMNQQVLMDYANGGGRVFASHFHYSWFDTGPFATTISPALATWTTSVQAIGNISSNLVTTLPNGMPFPEGVALSKWLSNVGALNSSGELPIIYACHNADLSAMNTYAQPWVSADKASPAPNATEYFSFDMPVGSSAEGKCGRVVYSDMHVSGGAGMSRGSLPADYASTLQIVPDQCATGALSPQEKALEFMVFDLSSCLIPPGQDQIAPRPQ